MKKLITTFIVIAMVAVFFVGCASPSTTPEPAASPTPAEAGAKAPKVPAGILPLASDSATRIDNTNALIAELAEAASNYDKNAAKYTYTVNCVDPAGTAQTKLIYAWADAVLVATEGAVHLEIGVSNAFSPGGSTESINELRNGLVDFAITLQNYTISYWPLSLVIQNPALGCSGTAVASSVIWDIYKSMPAVKDEYKTHGVPLFVFANDSVPLSYKAASEITNISEIKGNIRAGAGPMQMFVNEVGASVFACPITDVYTNIQNGVIDYLIAAWQAIDSFKLSDPGVCNYFLDAKIGNHAHVLIANLDTWAEIERNGYADAIMSVSGDYLLNLISTYEEDERTSREHILANGGSIHVPSGQLATDLQTAYDNVAKRWVEETSGEAQVVFDKAVELASHYNGLYH